MPPPLKHAFTLTETLASLTILSVFITASATCIQLAARAASSTRQKLNTCRQIRLASRTLLNDFRHAVISNDTPLHINPPPGTVMMSDQLADTDIGDTVFFFTKNSTAGTGDLCAAGYYLTAPINNTCQLRRYFQNSNLTWQSAGPDSGFLPHSLDPANPLFPAVGNPANSETLITRLNRFRLRPLRADATAPADWPPHETPALLEILFNIRERGLTQEFKINVLFQ
jgi:prepilin-type N-terminal cleavage/methylation domain-containing protein